MLRRDAPHRELMMAVMALTQLLETSVALDDSSVNPFRTGAPRSPLRCRHPHCGGVSDQGLGRVKTLPDGQSLHALLRTCHDINLSSRG